MSARDELMKKYGNSKEQKPKSGASGSGIGSKVAAAVSAATNVKLPEKKSARQTLVERYGSADTEYAIRARTAKTGLEKFRADKARANARNNHPRVQYANRGINMDTGHREPNERWQEDWLEEFGVRYNTDPESAYTFAQEVNDYLAAERLTEREIPYKNFAEKHPVLATAASVATAPLGLLDTLGKGLDYLDDGHISQRSSVTPGAISRTLSGAVAEDLNEKYGTLDEGIPIIGGKGWGDAYSLGNSALQSLVLGNTIGSGATLATFFGQGASSGMEEIKARGGSDGQAILYGLISGGAEVLTEKLPLDNLLKGGDAMRYTLKGWLGNAAKQGLLEGGEELASSVANEMADRWIMGDKSNFAVRVQEYMDQGMDKEEAEKKAWMDYANDAIFDFVGGMASGSTSMMVQTGLPVALANRQAGRASTPESDATLIERALAADEGTRPHKLAQKHQGAGKLSGGQINDLEAAYSEYETEQRYNLAAEKARERLEQADAEDSTVTAAIAKTLTGKELNRRERRALERSAEGKKVLQDMQFDRSWQREAAAAESRDKDGTAEDPFGGPEVIDQAEPSGISEQLAVDNTSNAAHNAAAVLDNTANAAETVDEPVAKPVEADYGDFTASESGRAEFDGKPVDIKGIKDTRGDMTLELEDGRTVKASEVLYATEGEALVYEAVASLGAPADIGNILVKNYRDGAEHVEAEDYAMGMSLAFNHGRHNLPKDQMTANPYIAKLTDVQRNSAYVLGQRFGGRQVASQEAIAHRARFGQRFQELGRPLTGRVHYDGDVRKLNVRQRASISALEKVAQALGVQIHLFESQADENGVRQGENGWYNTKTGDIGIDIHAGISGEDTMLFTAAHELTHFIKQWSPAKFKVLANFLMEQYGQKGVSVEELVERQQAKALRGGRDLSFDEAFEEMVADSMETMLADGNVLEKLTKLGKQDKHLLEKLRDGLQELIQKIREVYKGLKPDSREGRYVAEMKDSLERMQELFVEALEEAGQNFQAAEQVKAETAASSQQNAEGAAQVQRGTENVHSEATKANETEQDDSDWEEFDASIEFSRRDHEKTAREGGVKFSLRAFEDGRRYVDVQADQEKFDGLSVAEKNKTAKTIIQRRFVGRVIGLENKVFVNGDSASEYVHPSKNITPDIREAKMRAAPELDNLLDAGFNFRNAPDGADGHVHPNVTGGFDYFDAIFKVGSEYYQGVINIMNVKRGKLLKDVTKIRNITKDIISSYGETPKSEFLRDVSMTSIDEGHQNVNTKLSARDSEGRELTREQQEYFKDSKVRDEDGRLMVMYHGTPSGKHTTFRSGTYFTPNQEYADVYQKPGASMLSSKKDASAPKTYEVYLNITKPFDTRNPAERKIFMEEYCRQWGTGAPLADSGLPDWTDGMDLQEFIEEMGYDYDGLILDEGATGGYGLEVKSRGLSYVTFSSEQVKNADNAKPTDDPDIRFSDRDPAEAKLNRALQKENAAQAEEIQYLRELVRLQGKVTNGTKFTRSSVRTLAKQLMKDAGAKGNYLELSEKLIGIYESIAAQDDPLGMSWGDIDGRIDEAARWLLDHIEVKPDRGEYANDILRDLRARRISLNEGQMAEVKSRYGSYNDFRRAMFGSFTLSKDGTPLDMLWQELASQYPDTFDADIGDADMPLKLAEIVEGLRETDLAAMEFEMQRDVLQEELRQKVYDGYWRVSTLHTVADKYQKEIDKLKERHRGTMEKLDKARKERDKANRLRIDSMRELRESKKKAVETLRKSYKDARKKSVEGRNKTILRHRIQKRVRELEKLLLKGDRKKHVMEGMRGFVENALASAEVLFSQNYSDEELILEGIGTRVTPEENRLIDETQHLLGQKKDLLSDPAIAAESEAVAVGDASGYDQRMKQVEKLDRQIAANMGKLNGVLVRERSRLNEATVSACLTDLAKAYHALGKSDDLSIRGACKAEVYEHLSELAEEVGGTLVRDMTLEQLKKVADAYQMVLTTVRNANKGFGEAITRGVAETAATVTEEIAVYDDGKRTETKVGQAIKKFDYNNLKPIYFFERLGSQALSKLFGGIRNGEDVRMRDLEEAQAFAQEMSERYGFHEWDAEKQYSFRSASGKNFKLNLGQIMSIYAYSRRHQALEHLHKGGVVINPETEIKEVVELDGKVFKVRAKVKGKVKDATAYNIDGEVLAQIIGSLTAEQKQFTEAMQDYLSDTMGAKGNEVSMAMYGIRQFTEQHYFPLKSAPQYMERAREDAKGEAKIKNAGFTKSTTKNASAPIILSSFMDVWCDHVAEMSTYHAFTLPLEDFYRVFNYGRRGTETAGAESVVASIENAFGSQAISYIDQLLQDINGDSKADRRESFAQELIRKHKKASVMTSASVLIQQPSAVGRAWALIDPIYFLGPKVTKQSHEKNWAQLKKYAPVAAIKEMGYFDMGMGQTVQDYLTSRKYEGFKEKAVAFARDGSYRDELLSKGPAWADEMTWSAIWNAVKREQHAQHKGMNVTSEEFLKLCGERFTEIIVKTQVYDSVLSRSANMRSKSAYMGMATAFMAESTVSANMLEDAIVQGKRGNKKYASRTVRAVYASMLLNSLMVAVWYAARDDDEDETYAEKYAQALSTELLDGINPITYYPFLKDIWSALQGYDIERADMTLLSRLAGSAAKITGLAAKNTAGMDEEELEKHQKKTQDAMWGVVDDLTALGGLSFRNVRRDILAVGNLYRTLEKDFTERDTSWGSLTDKVWDTVKNGIPVVGWMPDEGKVEKLYKATVAGDTAYVKRLNASYKTESALNNAIRKGLVEFEPRIKLAAAAVLKSDYSERNRLVEEIVEEGRFSRDNVLAAVNSWVKELTPDKESDGGSKAVPLYTYEDFYRCALNGSQKDTDTIREYFLEEKIAEGYLKLEAESAVDSSFRTQVKNAYMDDEIQRSEALELMQSYGGKSADEAETEAKKWDFELEQGYSWSARARGYRLGDISERELIEAVMDIEESSREEAEDYIRFLDLQTANQEVEITASDASGYFEYAEPAGIKVETYLDYKAKAAACEGDKGENGKTISGSKKAKMLEIIDSLPISDKQKDALYRANGWAESKIGDAPWH